MIFMMIRILMRLFAAIYPGTLLRWAIDAIGPPNPLAIMNSRFKEPFAEKKKHVQTNGQAWLFPKMEIPQNIPKWMAYHGKTY